MAIVLVTGAGRGLGLEFVRQYSAEGWQVLACARAPEKSEPLNELVRDPTRKVAVHTLDVGDFAAIEALAKRLAGTAIDVLLNVAGVGGMGVFGKTNYPSWLDVLRINTLGPLKMAESFVTHIAASGQKKIVTLSSILGSVGANEAGGMYSYRSSKAAVNAVMKSLSIDLKSRGIIAVPIHPGWVRTDMGGPGADIDVQTSVAGMVRVIGGLTTADSGKFFNYAGELLPW
jgi:NAD(P)-dependent dehydrogenase (short-subunit alcohol dehydrogenase family)